MLKRLRLRLWNLAGPSQCNPRIITRAAEHARSADSAPPSRHNPEHDNKLVHPPNDFVDYAPLPTSFAIDQAPFEIFSALEDLSEEAAVPQA